MGYSVKIGDIFISNVSGESILFEIADDDDVLFYILLMGGDTIFLEPKKGRQK